MSSTSIAVLPVQKKFEMSNEREQTFFVKNTLGKLLFHSQQTVYPKEIYARKVLGTLSDTSPDVSFCFVHISSSLYSDLQNVIYKMYLGCMHKHSGN